MLCASPILVLGFFLDDFGRVVGAWICTVLVLAAARSRWDLRNRVWYWVIVMVASLCQIPLIMFVPWMRRDLSYWNLLPLGFFDYVVVYWCINLAERVATRNDDVKPPG